MQSIFQIEETVVDAHLDFTPFRTEALTSAIGQELRQTVLPSSAL